MSLGSLGEIIERPHCRLCCLVTRTYLPNFESEEERPLFQDILDELVYIKWKLISEVPYKNLGLGMPRFKSIIEIHTLRPSLPSAHLVLAEPEYDCQTNLWPLGYQIGSNFIDFDKVKRFIPRDRPEAQLLQRHRVKENGERTRSRSDKDSDEWSWLGRKDEALHEKESCLFFPQVPDFRLIDLTKQCLVKPPRHVEYCAFSYVWGAAKFMMCTKSNVQELEQKGCLLRIKAQIPQGIQDAMKIATEIGFRYLWIDALCIVQDDSHGKTIQISNMDDIYQRSALTIVNASGANAGQAIDGVYPHPRCSKQNIAELKPGLKVVQLFPLFDVLKDSVYQTRAWT